MSNAIQPIVLLCGDEFQLQASCEDYLLKCNFDVRTADGLADCATILCEQFVDVLIVDAGTEWSEFEGDFAWLRRNAPLASVPILIAVGMEKPVELSLKTGIPACRCVQTPFRPAALYETIHAAAKALLEESRLTLSEMAGDESPVSANV